MKMHSGQWWFLGLVAVAMVTAGAARADASIIVTYTGTSPNTNPTVGGFTFAYDIKLGPGESLDTSKGAQFFTIYDFFGFTGVQLFTPKKVLTDAAGSFKFSSANTGVTPAKTAPDDDPSVPNLTYTYSGGVVSNPSGSPDILLGTLTAESTSNIVSNDDYAQQDTQGGSLFANIGTTQVPATVPEPGSIILLGSGLIGLASLARRRAKSAKNGVK